MAVSSILTYIYIYINERVVKQMRYTFPATMFMFLTQSNTALRREFCGPRCVIFLLLISQELKIDYHAKINSSFYFILKVAKILQD